MSEANQQPDLEKIRRNLGRMITAEAPGKDIESYLAGEGVTLADVRGDKKTRAADQLLEGVPGAARVAGGMVGGAMGVAAGAPTGPGAALTGLAGGILGSELAGQAADIVVDYIKGRNKTGSQRGREAVSNMTVDTASTVTMGIAGKLATAGVNKFIRPILANERAAAIFKDLQAADIDPEGAAILLGSRSTQAVENLERKLPVSSTVLQKSIKKTWDGISDFAEKIALKMGQTADPYRAGQIVSKGVKDFAENIDAEAGKLYSAIKVPNKPPIQLTPGGTTIVYASLDEMPVDLKAVKDVAAQIEKEIPLKATSGNALSVIRDVLAQPDTIDFATARRMRSTLANVSRNITETVSGQAKGTSKRLNTVLDDAMEATGKQLDPDAFEKFRDANAKVRAKYVRLEELAEVRDGQRGIDAWNAVNTGTNRDPTKLIALKKTISKDDWGEYIGARIRDMGLETSGGGTAATREFSPDRFLSSWRSLDGKVKDVMFGKTGSLRVELDRLARISGAAKEIHFTTNPSNTAAQALTGGGIGSAVTLAITGHPSMAALSLMGSVGGLYGSAKLLTNKDFVRWLGDTQIIHPANYQGLSAQIGHLAAIAKAQPEMREAIEGYLSAFSEQDAVKAARAVATGKGEKQNQPKPVMDQFNEARAMYADQQKIAASLPAADRARSQGSLRSENSVTFRMEQTAKKIAQLDAMVERMGDGQSNPRVRQEIAKLRRAQEKLARDALNIRGSVYQRQ